ncbi:hypothetical protein CFC21_041628 [Triticum aestivum]|uniref:DUF1618 domain-containing protein n=3 Tax=Triticum TaxID=4564 RepID=A0A9R1FJN3_WHEAT|nr:uncharacterized protein LOC123070259 [Triticum aestivum]KAF7030003.1 hypothetical protein CFC21_041628 [Triticum aestivum]CDM82111.1 unnamed protein product [Triticum aestivum]VAH78027.1 unnamed protein product [Triticum turgidum subsp. durum]
MMNRRQFLNLVVWSWSDRLYSLRRIDPSKNLFYESTQQAQKAASAEKRKKFDKTFRSLPDPIASFDPSPTGVVNSGLEWFELFAPRSSESRIVNSNKAGEITMFDADKRLILALPNLYQPKGHDAVVISVTHPSADEDSLYIMDRHPGRAVTRPRLPAGSDHPRSCFEVLEYKRSNLTDSHKGWHWRLLPPPPFVHLPGFQPSSLVTSYTTMDTVDGFSSICISSDKGFGTYCFDTACLDPSHSLGWRNLDEWRHVGDWALPFEGRAEFVREFDIWLGFKAATLPCRLNHLCAVDLSAMDHGREPIVQHVWEHLALPEEKQPARLCPMHQRLVNLGSGRFCIAKVFNDLEDGTYFAVLTGVELLRNEQDQSLQILKHKCVRYISNTERIRWVL